MSRFLADEDHHAFEGVPALFCLVAEQMAASDGLRDIRGALRRAVADGAADQKMLEDLRYYASASLLDQPECAENRARELLGRGLSRSMLGVLGVRFVQVLLTADRIISMLETKPEFPFPSHALPREVVEEVARLAKADAAGIVLGARVPIILTSRADNVRTRRASAAAAIMHAHALRRKAVTGFKR